MNIKKIGAISAVLLTIGTSAMASAQKIGQHGDFYSGKKSENGSKYVYAEYLDTQYAYYSATAINGKGAKDKDIETDNKTWAYASKSWTSKGQNRGYYNFSNEEITW